MPKSSDDRVVEVPSPPIIGEGIWLTRLNGYELFIKVHKFCKEGYLIPVRRIKSMVYKV